VLRFVLVFGRPLAPSPADELGAKHSTTVFSQLTLAQITQT
jgi:hypothetical protein